MFLLEHRPLAQPLQTEGETLRQRSQHILLGQTTKVTVRFVLDCAIFSLVLFHQGQIRKNVLQYRSHLLRALVPHRHALDDMSTELRKRFGRGHVRIRQQAIGPIVRTLYAD